jgi:hypothetical protein
MIAQFIKISPVIPSGWIKETNIYCIANEAMVWPKMELLSFPMNMARFPEIFP